MRWTPPPWHDSPPPSPESDTRGHGLHLGLMIGRLQASADAIYRVLRHQETAIEETRETVVRLDQRVSHLESARDKPPPPLESVVKSAAALVALLGAMAALLQGDLSSLSALLAP